MRWIAFGVAGLLLSGGCVERELNITSSPPGALVTYNDLEIGRTPLKKTFTYYGVFDAQVRLDGYETIKTGTPVIAPWWQWIGPDLIAELLPFRLVDRHDIHYTLTPLSQAHVDTDELMNRAQHLREQLETGAHTTAAPASKPKPGTRPTKPTTQPATSE